MRNLHALFLQILLPLRLGTTRSPTRPNTQERKEALIPVCESGPSVADEPWEIKFGYIGQEPKTFHCTEEEVDDLVRQIQFSFGTTSNWEIKARWMGA